MESQVKPLRADARRNRARVLTAAETVLARDGRDASMRQIAAEAEVGLGTIYRQFPTKEALLAAIITERTRELLADAAEAAAGTTDPGTAFFALFTRIVDHSIHKRMLFDALGDAAAEVKAAMAPTQQAMRRALAEALDRAQAGQAVRTDLELPELIELLTAGCLAAERNQWSDATRDRTLGFIFDGLRPRR